MLIGEVTLPWPVGGRGVRLDFSVPPLMQQAATYAHRRHLLGRPSLCLGTGPDPLSRGALNEWRNFHT